MGVSSGAKCPFAYGGLFYSPLFFTVCERTQTKLSFLCHLGFETPRTRLAVLPGPGGSCSLVARWDAAWDQLSVPEA